MDFGLRQESWAVLRGQKFRRHLYASVAFAATLSAPSHGLPQALTSTSGSSSSATTPNSSPQTGPQPSQPSAITTGASTGNSQPASPPNSLNLTAPSVPQPPAGLVAPTVVPPNSGNLSALPYYARRALGPVPTLARPFTFGGSISLDETGTDNVDGTPGGGDADLISTISLNLFMTEQTRLTQFAAGGTVDFQDFAHTSSLNNAGLGANGSGSVTLVDNFLTIDGDGSISDQFINQFAAPVTARATTAGRARQAAFEVGPHLTTSVGDLIDLEGRARYAQVDVQPLAGTTLPAGLAGNSEIEQYLGRIATSQNIRAYQMTITGEYLKDDNGFRLYNGLYSLYVGPSDGLQIVGRGGYESTTDPGITDIKGPVWSAGFIARPGRNGYIRVEYGSRFERPTWNAFAQVALTPVVQLSASYLRTLETEQALIARSLTDLTDFSVDQPIGTPSVPTFVALNLVNATFLTDDANLSLTWQPNRTTDVALLVGESHRNIFSTGTDERFLVSGINISHRMTRKLTLGFDVAFDKTLESSTGGFLTWDYRFSTQVSYVLTKDITVSASFARQEIFNSSTTTIPENAIEIGISKSF